MNAPPAGTREARRATGGMVVAMLLWGATFVVLRDSLDRIPPLELTALRFAAAAVVWALLVTPGALRKEKRATWRPALVGGAVSAIPMAGSHLFQAIGLTETSAGSSAFLTAAGTLFAGLFGWLLLRERPSAVLHVGVALALVGSALLGLRGDWRLGRGEAWTLAGALIYALQIVAVSRWIHRTDALRLVAVQTAVVAAMLLPFASRAPQLLAGLSPGDLARLSYLVIAGSVVASFLQVRAQRSLPVGRIGLLFALEPVFALGFAVTVGGESFVPRWWLGAAVILFAVLLVEARSSVPPGSRSSRS